MAVVPSVMVRHHVYWAILTLSMPIYGRCRRQHVGIYPIVPPLRALLVHCAQEMPHLVSFLPDLFSAFKGER
jgi:hypothetical protein